jgi:hypothetical protein
MPTKKKQKAEQDEQAPVQPAPPPLPPKDLATLQTHMERMTLADLKLLDLNARYMRHEQFARLVENLRRDGALTSVPLVAREEDGGHRVLSGNHRVMAAIEAGIIEADVMVIENYLTEARRIAIQLSHNAIAGEDDPTILARLYEQIEDVDWKQYTGLDDQILALLSNIDPPVIPQARLDFQVVSLVFLPEEVEQARTALQEASKLIPPGERWAARFSEYDGWMDALDDIASSFNIGNVATGVMLILALFERNKEQLREGYLNPKGETLHAGWVPLSSIFGVSKVPAKTAARLAKVAERIAGENDLPKGERWKVLDILSERSLNG